MEYREGKEEGENQNLSGSNTPAASRSTPHRQQAAMFQPPAGGENCPHCGATVGSRPEAHGASESLYVYALGRVTPHPPRVSVEKEFAQVSGVTDTANQTSRQVLYAALSQRQNRYLARQMCWVLTVEGQDYYVLQPQDPADLDLLIESVRPSPSPLDVDIVIGLRGPIAPPAMCSVHPLPVIWFNQIYSFDRDSLIRAIPRPEKTTTKQFEPVALEVFEMIQQLTDNQGALDDHRAMNYCAVRYPVIYATAADCYKRNFSLEGVESRLSRLSSARKIIDVVFTYTHRQTDVKERYFCRVDVTEEFPFLVTKLSPYYDR